MKYRTDITNQSTGKLMSSADLTALMEMVEEAVGDEQDMELAASLIYDIRMTYGYDAAHEVIRGAADCMDMARAFIAGETAAYVAQQARSKGMALGEHGYRNWLSLGEPRGDQVDPPYTFSHKARTGARQFA